MSFPPFFVGGFQLKQKIQYLKTKFILGSVSVFVGFVGATIALFQWAERTGVQYLFGNYSRYVLGFGGFAAMIFGAFLVNDAWVLRDVLMGKYGVPSSHETIASYAVSEEIETSGPAYMEIETFIPETDYKKRTVDNILRSYESDDGISGKLSRFFKRLKSKISRKPN